MSSAYVVLPPNVVAENATAMADHLDNFNFAVRSLFYIVSPNETSFQHVDEVPNYFFRAVTYSPLYFLVEIMLLLMAGRKMPSFGEAMCSACCGLLIFIPVAISGQMEMALYMWFYDNFHIVDLQWDSKATWFLCVLAVDLAFYVWHRAAHEVNLIWSVHQVHHSSQEFNVMVGVRLPAFNRYLAMLFYLPCAFFFPPSVFYAHYQLNYIFQFWIHTDVFPRIDALEYIFNTPSLHRVHHGRNRYCIDKNYGAVFSFWDRMFGTFESERPNEEIFYGLVHNVNSFDPIHIQFHHLRAIWKNLIRYEGIANKLSVIFKGPGWEPGKPRLGCVEDIPEVPEDTEQYSVALPLWIKVHLVVHFLISLFLFLKIKATKAMFSSTMVWMHGGFVLWSIVNQGLTLERRPSALLCESIRCAAFFMLDSALKGIFSANPYVTFALYLCHSGSFLICAANANLFRVGFKEPSTDKKEN